MFYSKSLVLGAWYLKTIGFFLKLPPRLYGHAVYISPKQRRPANVYVMYTKYLHNIQKSRAHVI